MWEDNRMDSQFLEFWGNYLLAAAKGQKQLEDLNQWIRQGFSGFEELTAMLKKFYGIELPQKNDADSTKAWQNAAADFQNSLDSYLTLMGLIPQEKYRALEQKYAALQNKVAELEDTIKVLRNLLAEKGTYQGETTKVFQDLVNRQAEAFETLMQSISAADKDEK
jgi:predicted  nucleic acid-binding Zn-ribbon protein